MKHREYLFKTVDKALEATFDTIALANAVKSPKYGVPTSGSTTRDKLSTGERYQQATWILAVAKKAVTPLQAAWLTLTYDEPGQARDEALTLLAEHFRPMARKPELLRAVIDREFIFGAGYCPPLIRIAKDTGVTTRGAEKACERIRPALAKLGEEANAAIHKVFKQAGYAQRAA
ncbi:hypothetical protein [Paraburkholderia phosphatilytica]|uniref:hypothetical protein n=1 Tax=Paraburkholderia phosphatilytica TaxID=2282883 RepID=UPI000E5264DC|nr:hypothetical protein [Paraburkholderia phosphatilytica]